MAAAHAPLSHTSPRILQPSNISTTNTFPPPASNSPSIPNQLLGPQKEWTLPPRPKPGRKPAQNAPPTKRKAQNREAQRAFRERRAAKVGELEDQMKQMGEEVGQKNQEMMEEISGLHAEIEEWKSTSERWRNKYEEANNMFNRERQSKQHLELQMQMMRESLDVSTDAVPLKPRAHRHQTVPDQHQNGTTPKSEILESLTCGNCSNDSRCQCIEEAFDLNHLGTSTADHGGIKRTLSPQNSTDLSKRVRPNIRDIEEPTEIDFTTRKPPNLPKDASSSSDLLATATVDSCGFCQDGTACICAELTRHNENERLSQENAAKVPRKEPSSSCTNDPGNCAQCQAIPESKNFCISLAASRTIAFDTSDEQPQVSRNTEPTLKCADAFNRLAQHPNYPEASTQLKTWVPQLATRAVPSSSSSHAGGFETRPAFEIEAASVLNVLKSFDVRFGDQQGTKGN